MRRNPGEKMLVIYDDDTERVFIEAAGVRVGDRVIQLVFPNGTARSLGFGEGWTKGEAVKSIEAQLNDERVGQPTHRAEIYLPHIQAPHKEDKPF